MDWFYTHNGSQAGPVSADELQRLVDRGEVLPSALVWRSGLGNWQPLAETGEFRLPLTATAPGMGAGMVPDLGKSRPEERPVAVSSNQAAPAPAQLNPYQPGAAPSLRGGYDITPWQGLIANAGWIKLSGVMMMIMGVLYALVLIGIPYIFIALAQLNAAKNLKILAENPNAETARSVSEELGKSFKIMGIMMIVGIVIMILYFLFIGLIVGGMVASPEFREALGS